MLRILLLLPFLAYSGEDCDLTGTSFSELTELPLQLNCDVLKEESQGRRAGPRRSRKKFIDHEECKSCFSSPVLYIDEAQYQKAKRKNLESKKNTLLNHFKNDLSLITSKILYLRNNRLNAQADNAFKECSIDKINPPCRKDYFSTQELKNDIALSISNEIYNNSNRSNDDTAGLGVNSPNSCNINKSRVLEANFNFELSITTDDKLAKLFNSSDRLELLDNNPLYNMARSKKNEVSSRNELLDKMNSLKLSRVDKNLANECKSLFKTFERKICKLEDYGRPDKELIHDLNKSLEQTDSDQVLSEVRADLNLSQKLACEDSLKKNPITKEVPRVFGKVNPTVGQLNKFMKSQSKLFSQICEIKDDQSLRSLTSSNFKKSCLRKLKDEKGLSSSNAERYCSITLSLKDEKLDPKDRRDHESTELLASMIGDDVDMSKLSPEVKDYLIDEGIFVVDEKDKKVVVNSEGSKRFGNSSGGQNYQMNNFSGVVGIAGVSVGANNAIGRRVQTNSSNIKKAPAGVGGRAYQRPVPGRGMEAGQYGGPVKSSSAPGFTIPSAIGNQPRIAMGNKKQIIIPRAPGEIESGEVSSEQKDIIEGKVYNNKDLQDTVNANSSDKVSISEVLKMKEYKGIDEYIKIDKPLSEMPQMSFREFSSYIENTKLKSQVPVLINFEGDEKVVVAKPFWGNFGEKDVEVQVIGDKTKQHLRSLGVIKSYILRHNISH